MTDSPTNEKYGGVAKRFRAKLGAFMDWSKAHMILDFIFSELDHQEQEYRNLEEKSYQAGYEAAERNLKPKIW